MLTHLPSPTSILAVSVLWLTAAAAAMAGERVSEVFEPFDALLSRHVIEYRLDNGGLVSSFDYRAVMQSNAEASRIREQRQRLAGFDPESIDTREQALAFWINAYNFFMIAHIVDNPEGGELVESVRDYGTLLDPYRVFERKLFDIGGERHALGQIEIDILLGSEFAERGWKDARVHFAVNCASVGCPPLRDTIYTAQAIDDQLSENARLALATPLHLQIEGDTLRLTSLFDWYADDFIEHSGSVHAFIREHAPASIAEQLTGEREIRYIDYDWALNSPTNITTLMKSTDFTD